VASKRAAASGSGVVGAAESVWAAEFAVRAASASERVFGVSWEGVSRLYDGLLESAVRVERKPVDPESPIFATAV